MCGFCFVQLGQLLPQKTFTSANESTDPCGKIMNVGFFYVSLEQFWS